ncbi:MAG TPA: NAD(P)H-dependent oxidoreductase [Propionibacteriaceae bacterium]|nr:NAD(P)H-dependent oxidoreductase [Propionibacteriaceae bacterium]
MADIVHISTGLRDVSRTDLVGNRAADRLRARGHAVVDIRVRDLPPGPLLWRQLDHPGIAAATHVLQAADAVIVSSAVYQASFSGLLKVFLDLLPKAGLGGKDVLPLLVGGSVAHVLTLDYALRPVLQALGAAHISAGRYVLADGVFLEADGGLLFSRDTADQVDSATDDFAECLEIRRAGEYSRRAFV